MPVGEGVEVLGAGSARQDVMLREISVTGSSVYKTYGIVDYNPDELVGRKGLQIYAQMRVDDQVKAVLTMKKFARLMTSWEIQPASQDARDIEIAEFCKDQIETMDGTFEHCLLNIYTALDFGYSISEIVYKQVDRGRWAGKIGLKAIKTREPFFYGFDSDQYGNLKENGIVFTGAQLPPYIFPAPPQSVSQQATSPVQAGQDFMGNRFPVEKFIIFSYNQEFSNWYGRSDLRAAYRSWWSKEVLIRFMNIYMERFGMPTHVGKYPRGTRKEDREELRDILDKVQAKYSIVVPADVEVSLLQSAMGGESGFRSAIEMHNRFISRSVLCPDLMGFTEVTGGGSYALGKKHFDVFLWILKQLGRETEESLLGEQVLKRLVDLNFGEVDRYPKFRFESITEEGTSTKAQIVAMGVANGFINPKEVWIREYLSMPKLQEGLDLGVFPRIPVPDLTPELRDGPEVPTGGEGLEGEEAPPIEDARGVPMPRPDSKIGQYIRKLMKYYQARQEEPNRSQVSMYISEGKPQPTTFDRKLDFTKAVKSLNAYREETTKALADIVGKMRNALISDVQRKDLVRHGTAREIDKLQLKYIGDFKRELERRSIKLYLDSKLKALFELVRGGAPLEVSTRFQDMSVQLWEPLPPKEAMEFFNRKVLAKVVKKDGKKVLMDLATLAELSYYSSKAFAISGIERDYILQEAKQILLEGLRSGDTRVTMFNLDRLFDEYLATGEIVDGELTRPYRLEVIVRTNESEALTAGRRSIFEDPDVQDFVPYWQYTAILDDRVRPSHSRMHGRIYRSNDPIWSEITPPNGFNCRCSITAVTSVEVDRVGGVSISRDPLPSEFPDGGFRKFVKDIEYRRSQATIEEFSDIGDHPQLGPVQVRVVSKEPGQVGSWERVLSPDGRRVPVYRVERVVVGMETPRLRELRQQIEAQQKQLEVMQELVGKTQAEQEIVLLRLQLSDMERRLSGLRQERELEKLEGAETVSAGVVEGYEWVTKCPYSACGGASVAPRKRLAGAVVYTCSQCQHLFKVLQEGDVYFYDIGTEAWVSAEMSARPSYFVAEVEGVEYRFSTELERDRRMYLAKSVGLVAEVKTYKKEDM